MLQSFGPLFYTMETSFESQLLRCILMIKLLPEMSTWLNKLYITTENPIFANGEWKSYQNED